MAMFNSYISLPEGIMVVIVVHLLSVTLWRRLQRRHHDAETASGMNIHPVEDEANGKTETLETDAKTNRLWIETSCCSEGEAVQV